MLHSDFALSATSASLIRSRQLLLGERGMSPSNALLQIRAKDPLESAYCVIKESVNGEGGGHLRMGECGSKQTKSNDWSAQIWSYPNPIHSFLNILHGNMTHIRAQIRPWSACEDPKLVLPTSVISRSLQFGGHRSIRSNSQSEIIEAMMSFGWRSWRHSHKGSLKDYTQT